MAAQFPELIFRWTKRKQSSLAGRQECLSFGAFTSSRCFLPPTQGDKTGGNAMLLYWINLPNLLFLQSTNSTSPLAFWEHNTPSMSREIRWRFHKKNTILAPGFELQLFICICRRCEIWFWMWKWLNWKLHLLAKLSADPPCLCRKFESRSFEEREWVSLPEFGKLHSFKLLFLVLLSEDTVFSHTMAWSCVWHRSNTLRTKVNGNPSSSCWHFTSWRFILRFLVKYLNHRDPSFKRLVPM